MRRDDALGIGAAVPGVILPLATTAVAVTAGMLLGAVTGWVVAMGVVCLLSGVARVLGGPWICGAILVVLLVVSEPAPVRTAVVILAVHLLHVLGSLSLVVPLRAWVTLRALRPSALRFVVIQLAGQAAGTLAILLPQGGTVPAAVVGGSLATLSLAVAGRRMLRGQRASGYAVTSGIPVRGAGVGGHS